MVMQLFPPHLQTTRGFHPHLFVLNISLLLF
nr:MAG TPA: hypothetical protein [Bacteriophage sp.]